MKEIIFPRESRNGLHSVTFFGDVACVLLMNDSVRDVPQANWPTDMNDSAAWRTALASLPIAA